VYFIRSNIKNVHVTLTPFSLIYHPWVRTCYDEPV